MLDEIISGICRGLTERPIMKVNPCPHCGAAAIVIKSKKHKGFPYKVKCLNAFCSCQTERYNELDGAVRAWNRRTAGDEKDDQKRG